MAARARSMRRRRLAFRRERNILREGRGRRKALIRQGKTMSDSDAIEVEAFYRYGYRGREMIAIRSPFAMTANSEIIGRRVRVGAAVHRVLGVWRQISGPIQKGEPVGVEVEADSVVKGPSGE